MNSQFGQTFLFLTDLAYKCRVTLPVLVTAVFMVMDIRLQIEIHVQTGQVTTEFNELDYTSSSDESWETVSDDDFDDANSDNIVL